jgi:hypothetical protein
MRREERIIDAPTAASELVEIGDRELQMPGELIYEYTPRITGIVEYGPSSSRRSSDARFRDRWGIWPTACRPLRAEGRTTEMPALPQRAVASVAAYAGVRSGRQGVADADNLITTASRAV